MNKASKLIIILLIATICLTLCGCNMQIIDTKYKFSTATINYGDHTETYYVSKWTDYSDSDVVQFTDTNGVTHLTSYNNVVLEG